MKFLTFHFLRSTGLLIQRRKKILKVSYSSGWFTVLKLFPILARNKKYMGKLIMSFLYTSVILFAEI